MLPPDYLDHIADEIIELYQRFEISVIKDMARRIAKIGVSESSLHQMEIVQQAGVVYENVIKVISATTGREEKELDSAFVEAGSKALRFDDSVYKAMGQNPLPVNQSTRMLDLLNAGVRKTRGTLHNLTMTTAITSQQAYIQACNLAYMQVSSGAMSHTEAIKRAVRDISKQGIHVIDYATGRREKVDVAVRRSVLTGVNQTCAELSMMRMDEMNHDLVETTAHFGARPTHDEWQGQVFSRNGAHNKYPDFVDSTGYGSGEGLCGWNCRHSFFPFYEGFSGANYSGNELRAMRNATVNYDGQEFGLYEATQKQRSVERSIRSIKRELAGLDSAISATGDQSVRAGLRSEFTKQSVRLKQKEAALRDFINQTGLRSQKEREQVQGFSRSVAQRAVWANKKAK